MPLRTLCLLLAIIGTYGHAVPVQVIVTAPGGEALSGGVVYLTSDQPLPEADPEHLAQMDQVSRQFKPHVLVVQKGSRVIFPNSDSIKHHVYSFSPAKTFELELYKDRAPEPLTFDKQGQVELGCNVHDWMLGYIYVVDTPYFTRTNQDGQATLDVPKGNYQLHVRHPRLDEPSPVTQPLEVKDSVTTRVTLSNPLLPGINYQQDEDEFMGY
ncbi:hypothetical protein HMF8227_00627 [Saliniradius amylolyticus]|uniref:Methylamine utilization protein n=1 Tax=Saliniradius amylolyticus TaxID=2183582 RepID=A0A2S2E0H5_9ALTE|nr:methylamine utilization protein [Saliniradius amylolyticus]AWL11123.1 hypothetical protein HMF8227_00627 [Saliniradius amylolyticus]